MNDINVSPDNYFALALVCLTLSGLFTARIMPVVIMYFCDHDMLDVNWVAIRS